MSTLTEVFPCFFLSCKAKCQGKTRKEGARPALFLIFVLFYIYLYCLFCVVLCIVCVYMCTVVLPPGGYPFALNKYIISYIISCHIFDKLCRQNQNSHYVFNDVFAKIVPFMG